MSVREFGSTVSLTFEVVDPATGLLTTPATRVLTVTPPSGAPQTPAATVLSAGTLLYQFVVNLAGVWRFALVTTTPNDTRDGALVVAVSLGDVPWIPNVTEVATWIPERTLDVTTVGTAGQLPTNTFSTKTQPSGAQVDDLIYAASSIISGRVGTVDPTLYGLADKAAAVRAAAYVELTYPRREGGINQYEELIAVADSMLDALSEANVALTGTAPGAGSTLLPVWSMPDPVTYGDLDL